MSKLLSVKDVAAKYNRAVSTVRQNIIRGAIKAEKVGDRWYYWVIREEDAARFYERIKLRTRTNEKIPPMEIDGRF